MSAQTRYSYSTPMGAPGGIVDLAPHAIDTFLNEENTGVMKPGFGVVYGTTPGVNIKLPVSGKTAANFAGIVTNNRTTEYDLEGAIHVRKGAAMGVMRYGRIYGRVPADTEIAYGDPVKLIITGDHAGKFCATAPTGASTVNIKGRFLSTVDTTTEVAMIELFNEAQ